VCLRLFQQSQQIPHRHKHCPAMNPSYQTTQGGQSPSGANFRLPTDFVPAAHQTGAIVVQVYSGLLNIREEWPSTWMVIRAMDDRGCGWVDTNWAELAALKDCSTATIRRHFAAGLGVAFRSYKKYRGGIRIYYTSIVKGLRPLRNHRPRRESATNFPPHCIDRGPMLVPLQSMLRRAKDALYMPQGRMHPKEQKRKVLDARKYIEPTCDNSVRVKRRSKYFRVSDGFSVPGISISALADRSGYSDRTIKTRLSNNWRLERGLDLIQKQRVLTQLDYCDQLLYSEFSQSFIDRSNSRNGKYHLIKFIGGIAYRLGVNVYNTSYELRSCRFLRVRVKSAIRKMN
jgi:hypothetical protein